MSYTLTKPHPKPAPGNARPKRRDLPGDLLKEGVVRSYVNPGKSDLTLLTSHNLIEVIQQGLPVSELADLQASLDVTTERLAPMLGISKATLQRHKTAGARLGADVSDRVVRYALLMRKAVEALGDREDARHWLNTPQFGLGNAVPLDYARTEVGAREVENLLGRIEYGVYS